MKISNRKEITISMYLLFILILLDITLLFFAKKIASLPNYINYIIFSAVFTFSIWKLAGLKIFMMEVTDHIISIRYNHPLLDLRKPVLEVPLQKVVSFETEKILMSYVLIVAINTKKGTRKFYYKIGNLPQYEQEKLRIISTILKSV